MSTITKKYTRSDDELIQALFELDSLPRNLTTFDLVLNDRDFMIVN
jgi:hypothetical protein